MWLVYDVFEAVLALFRVLVCISTTQKVGNREYQLLVSIKMEILLSRT